MRNFLFLAAVILTANSCIKTVSPVESDNKWNGYAIYLKTGEQVHTLWAGQYLDVGTVTYGIDDSANFYVTYDCSASGWLISETHMFAGDKTEMPLNKPGAPKIGRFPYAGNHNPWLSLVTYKVPLASLPPCTEPGFVVASHCVVQGPSGETETAWAEGEYTFSDKGWGWYDDFYYNHDYTPTNIIYGITFAHDSLRLFHLDMSNESVELILVEYVGNSAGTYDAAAYDPASGRFFFSKCTGELYVNHLNEEGPSVFSGFLQGFAASATFHEDNYYYVDQSDNSINKVNFTNEWTIANEEVLDTIPWSMIVNDIAMSQTGNCLYLMANHLGNINELIIWNMEDHTFSSTALTINNGAQITYGSDGNLYAIAPLYNEGSVSWIYVIDTDSITLTVIEDEVIIIDDPFTDLSRGPSF